MELTADELAGVVDIFGTLTRSELRDALSELAFKQAGEFDDPDIAVDDAVESYHLVGVDCDGQRVLVPGPAAFPKIPAGATDLPHILDVTDRELNQNRLAEVVAERFREESVVAIRSENVSAVEQLIDVSYELEVWGAVEVSGERERLADARDELTEST